MCVQASGGVARILQALTNLHALRRLEADQGWLLTENILSLDAARGIPVEIRYPPAAPHAHAHGQKTHRLRLASH